MSITLPNDIWTVILDCLYFFDLPNLLAAFKIRLSSTNQRRLSLYRSIRQSFSEEKYHRVVKLAAQFNEVELLRNFLSREEELLSRIQNRKSFEYDIVYGAIKTNNRQLLKRFGINLDSLLITDQVDQALCETNNLPLVNSFSALKGCILSDNLRLLRDLFPEHLDYRKTGDYFYNLIRLMIKHQREGMIRYLFESYYKKDLVFTNRVDEVFKELLLLASGEVRKYLRSFCNEDFDIRTKIRIGEHDELIEDLTIDNFRQLLGLVDPHRDRELVLRIFKRIEFLYSST